MKKIIRDDFRNPIGYTDTKLKKGTYNEFCDKAGYTFRGYISETFQSLNHDEREDIKAMGKLF